MKIFLTLFILFNIGESFYTGLIQHNYLLSNTYIIIALLFLAWLREEFKKGY